MKDSGRQKDRQRWERKEWASLVEKHPRRVKASPWGHTSDFKMGTPVATLPGVRRYRVSAGNGWPYVSIL